MNLNLLEIITTQAKRSYYRT